MRRLGYAQSNAASPVRKTGAPSSMGSEDPIEDGAYVVEGG